MGATSNPRINAQLLAAAGQIAPDPFRILITGQIGTDGSAVDGQTYEEVQDLTNSEVTALFGTKSELTGRILRCRKLNAGRFPLWVIGKDAVVGTAANVDLLYAGTATEDKVMRVHAIDDKLYSFNVSVENGDTAEEVATKVKAGLDALPSTFIAANALVTATITLTANDSGTIGNKYTIYQEKLPAGITVNTNVGESRDQFSSGATDPVLTGLFDNVQSIRFHTISWPWESDFSEVQDLLETRNVVSNAFLHGMAFIGFDGTEAEIKAKVNGTTPLNSPNLIFIGNRQVSGASAIVTPADWRAIEFASIEALRQTPDVPLGQYITVTSPLDAFGNPGLASLAFYNTPLAETGLTDPNLLFDNQEQINLESDGYSIIGINESNSRMITGGIVSTYKFNTKGEDDVSFKYLNYIRTGFLALEIFFKTLKSDYSQFRLTEGDVVAGRAMTNKESIEAEYTRIYKLLSGPDYVLTQSGTDAESFFFKNLLVSTDLSTGTVTSSGQLPIVTQVRQFNMTFQLAFSIGG